MINSLPIVFVCSFPTPFLRGSLLFSYILFYKPSQRFPYVKHLSLSFRGPLGKRSLPLPSAFSKRLLKKTPLPLIFLSIRVLLKDFFLCLVSPRASSRKPLFSSFFLFPRRLSQDSFCFSPLYALHAPLKKLLGNVFADCGGLFPSAREKRESFCAKRRSLPKLRLFICFRFSKWQFLIEDENPTSPFRFGNSPRAVASAFFRGFRLYLRKFASPIFYIRDAFAARLRHRSTPRRPFFPAFSQLPPPLP